jgi:hypothetical protein
MNDAPDSFDDAGDDLTDCPDMDTQPQALTELLLARLDESDIEPHRRALRSVLKWLAAGDDPAPPSEIFARPIARDERGSLEVVVRTFALVCAIGGVGQGQVEALLARRGIDVTEFRAALESVKTLPAIAGILAPGGG